MTKRDLEIVNFIRQMKVVNSNQIQSIFRISQVVANRRLINIVNEVKEIKRERDKYSMNYLYFAEKPTKHKLLISEFYSRLVKYGGKIVQFENEYSIGGLRADAFCIYEFGNNRYYFMVEIQLSHRKADIEKYEELYRNYNNNISNRIDGIIFNDKIFPRIVVISDRVEKYSGGLRVIWIDDGMNKFEEIFK